MAADEGSQSSAAHLRLDQRCRRLITAFISSGACHVTIAVAIKPSGEYCGWSRRKVDGHGIFKKCQLDGVKAAGISCLTLQAHPLA